MNVDLRDAGPDQGLWQIPFEKGEAEQLNSIPSSRNVPIRLEYSADGRYLMTFEMEPRQSGMTVRIATTVTGELIDIDPQFPVMTEDMTAPYIMGAGWSPVGSGLVYAVRDPLDDSKSGLYLTAAPGKPGKMILQGRFYGTTCCQRMPIQWAVNDLIMIGRGGESGVLLVQVGMPG
ncbi:MAG: hypothetical protein IPK19_17785 [Chloroflexi bacterium]|nr:hypothetical protein [Chloroflexota bacterium]